MECATAVAFADSLTATVGEAVDRGRQDLLDSRNSAVHFRIEEAIVEILYIATDSLTILVVALYGGILRH